ncbi:MAG: VWA domain-containing protein [Mariprofundales bacterium]|nr:VWA domain-containing protein [Mariprofundales bacterium]
MGSAVVAEMEELVDELRERLGTSFPAVDKIFTPCAQEAIRLLTAHGVDRWLQASRTIGSLGRGAEPMLVYMEEAPRVAQILGEDALDQLLSFVCQIASTPNADAIVPFLQSSVAAARRLEGSEMFAHYLQLIDSVMARTTPSVHGIVAMHASPCLVDLLNSVPTLLRELSISGMRSWVEFGVESFRNDPEGQSDYFALQAPIAYTVLQRERHGTLLVDNERLLNLYLRSSWRSEERLYPYSLLFDELRKPKPYWDRRGIHLPDIYDDLPLADGGSVSAINRYRALLAHIAAHQRWTTPVVADNLAPFQSVAAEVFEDLRVESLAIAEWPGLRNLWLALHPTPDESAGDGECSTIYHRLALFSRAVLDPHHRYRDAILLEQVAEFHALTGGGNSTTQEMVEFAVRWYLKTKQESDRSPNLLLDDTEVEYRDDNRHMWIYIEPEEEELTAPSPSAEEGAAGGEMPPRHYDEWDQRTQLYRPDWVSLYEYLHPSSVAEKIDALLDKHRHLLRRLTNLMELLKPQNRVRIRYQEEGSELDLDVAIRALIDYKAGSQPDDRINMSHRRDGRSISVLLLLDLSVSLNEQAEGCSQTILELSQEAVALLAAAVEQAGDPLAIGGFHSNSRHEVNYYHFKGFNEPWGDSVKGRLAAMEGAYSTRIGAAIRHAGAALRSQQSDKRLLLIVTDGRPHDVDVKDDNYLVADAHQAVQELKCDGIYSYCINLDAKADEYVSTIFGQNYTIIDHVDRLPERLPELFISLTK